MAKSVRIPEDLYADVKKQAAKEERSISNMVAVLLRKALESK